jgi:CopG antitoxin of type II toxin-antitoxin system
MPERCRWLGLFMHLAARILSARRPGECDPPREPVWHLSMSENPQAFDPIPEEFGSYEEAAEFWDTHDTTDYPENFVTVAVDAELQRRHYEIEIDEELIGVLVKTGA